MRDSTLHNFAEVSCSWHLSQSKSESLSRRRANPHFSLICGPTLYHSEVQTAFAVINSFGVAPSSGRSYTIGHGHHAGAAEAARNASMRQRSRSFRRQGWRETTKLLSSYLG